MKVSLDLRLPVLFAVSTILILVAFYITNIS